MLHIPILKLWFCRVESIKMMSEYSDIGARPQTIIRMPMMETGSGMVQRYSTSPLRNTSRNCAHAKVKAAGST